MTIPRYNVRVHLGLSVRELGDEELEQGIEWVERFHESLGQHVRQQHVCRFVDGLGELRWGVEEAVRGGSTCLRERHVCRFVGDIVNSKTLKVATIGTD